MTYPGSPLYDVDSYRLMHLQPGQLGDRILVQLETIASSKKQRAPDYEALSYTWGDATLQQEIFCGDHSAGDPCALKVTTNCYNALQSLRYPDRPRLLWIDAICIDQTNIEERNAQVKMMGAIFACAREVVVYLGESADDSDTVIAWYKNNFEVPDYPRKDIAVSKPSSDAQTALARRPWFTRPWILQEAANARSATIMWGTLTMP